MVSPAGEFSHNVMVNPWPDDAVVIELTASAAEREGLRARFDLVELASLHASAEIEKRTMELVLTGRIEAEVAQTCVVTLQPVAAKLDVSFERRYRRQDAHEKMIARGEAGDLDEESLDVEILVGDEIDVGEAVAEELSLALDPYPRAADADQALVDIKVKTGTGEGEGRANPFEKLRTH